MVGQCGLAEDMVYIIDFVCREEIFGERGWDMFDFCSWWDGHFWWCWKFDGRLLGVGGLDAGQSFLYISFGGGRGWREILVDGICGKARPDIGHGYYGPETR